ncbi:UDP-glucose dehydrogenase family protein [Paenibacillus koleovorans]|uniref:UDP-glucose dehydrogenase family protein n=1 Tax=Paenibacillus koleovorans TaxID=121608 RepID=UPI000FD6DD2A|nr:UDP-glucose/GDP-mannose dehydrogenase family protein [Paenibacillus koleovorans]
MNVAVIGSGYVGSVTGAAFATLGHPTIVIDIDRHKAERLNAGESPIYEPGLEELLRQAVGRGQLSATTDYAAVRQADVVFIAVGTPSRPDGSADLTYVRAAAASIGAHLDPRRFTVVVDKSTVPVGTSDLVGTIIEQSLGRPNRDEAVFTVVSNPEFLREGYALEDVFFPDRIVIGTEHEEARRIMRSLYRRMLEPGGYGELQELYPFRAVRKRQEPVWFETDAKSAELIKYVSNAFLSVKISYVNEVARLCEKLGANALDVSYGMGLDTRIGPQFLQVSSGWSGSCFPKDTAELLHAGRKYGIDLSIVNAAVLSNERMHQYCVDKIAKRLKTLTGKRIGVLGLTFKPNTDDARHTQASFIIERLLELGAEVAVHDPKGMEMFRRLHDHLSVRYCGSAEEVASQADAIVLLTHWPQYGTSETDWRGMRQRMRTPYVLDTRNVLNAPSMRSAGWDYEGLGVHY